MKDYIEGLDKQAERRFISPQMEVRMEGDEGIIEGIAAVVEKTADMGWYEERIEKGAFDDVLNDDVVALFNHDTNMPLARSVNGKGSLTLRITEEGHLAYSYKSPDRTYARDLLDAIKTGDVSKSSFAFRIKDEEWLWAEEGSRANDVRVIKKVERLFDVSPVTRPAYNDTDVAARSMKKEHKKPINNLSNRQKLFKRKFSK